MAERTLQVLVVDDEPSIQRFLGASLTAFNYHVLLAGTAHEALAVLDTARPDLIVLDLGLPDMDGLDLVRRIRKQNAIPIIILSVREDESDKVIALDEGADDYVTKPFGLSELLARMRVALRRSGGAPSATVFTLGDLTIDFDLRTVHLGATEVLLTPTEYNLLRLLVTESGRVLTHRQLLRGVWGPGYDNEAHLLRVTMSNLRHKIEPDPNGPRYIRTEPGVGYRLRG
jgi:two-component system, OmpR family, KDP operon response regulator KdpE